MPLISARTVSRKNGSFNYRPGVGGRTSDRSDPPPLGYGPRLADKYVMVLIACRKLLRYRLFRDVFVERKRSRCRELCYVTLVFTYWWRPRVILYLWKCAVARGGGESAWLRATFDRCRWRRETDTRGSHVAPLDWLQTSTESLSLPSPVPA